MYYFLDDVYARPVAQGGLGGPRIVVAPAFLYVLLCLCYCILCVDMYVDVCTGTSATMMVIYVCRYVCVDTFIVLFTHIV